MVKISNNNGLVKWKQSRTGQAVSGLIFLALAYGVGSMALDTGSWWRYLLTVALLVYAIQNFNRALKPNGKK